MTVNHDAVIAQTDASYVMPSAMDWRDNAVLAGKFDAGHYVGDSGTTRDHGRMFVDCRIAEFASFLVAGLAGEEKLAAQRGTEFVQGIMR